MTENTETLPVTVDPEVKEGELLTKANAPKTVEELFTSKHVEMALDKLGPKHLSAERFLRIANTAMTRNPKLLSCTVSSVWNCLIELSTVGLEPDGRHAHLIPYKKECTLIIDYKGLVVCIRRSGEVSYIHCDVVYTNDFFEFEYGSNAGLKHKPVMVNRGERACVYSFVKMKDGAEDFKVYPMEHIEAIRDRSQAKNSGPWKDKKSTDYDEMCKKTALRNHSKWLPFSAETHDIITADDKHLFPNIGKDSIDQDDIANMADGSRQKIAPPPPIKDAESEAPKNTTREPGEGE